MGCQRRLGRTPFALLWRVLVLVLVVATLGFPGAGHVTLGRRQRGCVWAAVGLVALAATSVTVWGLVGLLAIRFAASIDLAACLRTRPTRARYGEALALVGVTVLAMIALRLLVVAPFGVPSSSMVPTIEVGDSVIVNLRARTPVRGAIVAFVQPCERDHTYLKRVIALGGDTVEVRCQAVYVNGKVVTPDGYQVIRGDGDRGDFPSLRMPFSPHCANAPSQPTGKLEPIRGTAAPCEPQLHLVVPAETMFVLGDNRPSSLDSRELGVVPVGDLVGRVVGIYAPARFGDLR